MYYKKKFFLGGHSIFRKLKENDGGVIIRYLGLMDNDGELRRAKTQTILNLGKGFIACSSEEEELIGNWDAGFRGKRNQ